MGVTDNGVTYSYPTDSMIQTNKENYSEFLNNITSKQFCLLYAQSFEGLERLLKNLLFELIDRDLNLKLAVESKLKKDQKLSRDTMPSGVTLAKLINKTFDLFSYQKGDIKFDLKISFFILSKTRHTIIHNNYTFYKSEMFCSTNQKIYLSNCLNTI